MKKNTHPQLQISQIILKNGSTYLKKWVYFRKNLKTDSDFLKNSLWHSKNKNF